MICFLSLTTFSIFRSSPPTSKRPLACPNLTRARGDTHHPHLSPCEQDSSLLPKQEGTWVCLQDIWSSLITRIPISDGKWRGRCGAAGWLSTGVCIWRWWEVRQRHSPRFKKKKKKTASCHGLEEVEKCWHPDCPKDTERPKGSLLQ